MEYLVSRTCLQLGPKAARISTLTWTCYSCRVQLSSGHAIWRTFATTRAVCVEEQKKTDTFNLSNSSYAQPAAELSQDVTDAEKDHFKRVEKDSKDRQRRSPWMHEGADKPPVARMRSAGARTKGKLLTTPSRMLKLILPLTARDANQDKKDAEPLALVVHPQQPLSYLERLIQSELPLLKDGDKERIPEVKFRAEDAMDEDVMSGTPDPDGEEVEGQGDTFKEDGKTERTGKVGSGEKAEKPPPEDPSHPNFVRWSPSTEIGDFIRDAARGKEFSVDIEGAPPIYVGVPSFQDRTYYLRMRLRKASRRIYNLADLKTECDRLARQGAKRVAQGGFAALIGWWGAVYYLTFKTDLGWNVVEPVTYLVGLSGLIGGYMWFLYHNREVSYRSAMNLTISRRQSQLYEQKGFNLSTWDGLVEEANRLRREIKMVADEYDVEWDETKDEHDEKVVEALRKDRKKSKDKNGKNKDKDDDDDDDDND